MSSSASQPSTNLIEQHKSTVNSVSILFKNPGNITSISCHHLAAPSKLESFLGSKGEWQLVTCNTIDAETEHISFHFLESGDEYKLLFHAHDTLVAEHKFKCTDHDMSCDLAADCMDMVTRTFGLPSSLYISPAILDLDYNLNDEHVISRAMSIAWIGDNDKDWLWYAVPKQLEHDIKHQASFLKLLLLNGLFALPSGSVAQKLADYFGAKQCAANARIQMMMQRYSHQIMLCPNPVQRQVIDFRASAVQKLQREDTETKTEEDCKDVVMRDEAQRQPQNAKDQNADKRQHETSEKRTINWSRNKKLKRYKKQFYLSVNYKFKENLKICKAYHIEREYAKRQKEKLEKEQSEKSGNPHSGNNDENEEKQGDGNKEEGTWITDTFIEMLEHLRQTERKQDVLKFVTFELWERESNEVVAASFAYITGSIVCDYTFMTLKRDHRSCGSILTKVIGHILHSCHYDLWYWGFRLDYMTDYDKYGGTEIHRSEYANVLKHSCCKPAMIVNQQNETVLDIVQFIKNGHALIEPLPQWLTE